MATDKQIIFVEGPTANRGGDVEFKWIDVNNNNTWNLPVDLGVDEWHVDVDFNPDITTPPDGPSILRYFIKIIDPNPYLHFQDVSLGSIIGPGTGSVTKQVYDGTNNLQGTLLGTLSNPGTSFLDLTQDPNKYRELYIIDTATPGTSTIDAYQNIYRQVPGPLPIVGAGAAFGFSRKLRSRIKANSAA